MFRHVTGFQSFLRRHDRISKFSNGVLEGLSDTNPPEIGPRNRGGLRSESLPIFTLDPKKFAEKNQPRFHIGHKWTMKLYVLLLNQSSTATSMVPRVDYNQIFQISSDGTPTSKRQPFPPDTNAFLYYFMPPEKPRIAGELRLRVTSSDDPASFESGSDLLRPNGQPWSRPLLNLPRYYTPLYEKLREEEFIPDDLDRILLTLPLKEPRYNSNIPRLYTLNDTFIVDFSSKGSQFFVVTEKGIGMMPVFDIFVDQRKEYEGSPFTGSALVRFERSTLPEHNGTRNVVLRFLKIITPVKCIIPDYDGYISCPKEGELHRRSWRKGRYKVWSVNIDKSKGPQSIIPGLQLLWDA